jgi:hypothetical protein
MIHSGLVSARPAQDRSAWMYGDCPTSVLDPPAFVGAHWFAYADRVTHAPHGRRIAVSGRPPAPS